MENVIKFCAHSMDVLRSRLKCHLFSSIDSCTVVTRTVTLYTM